MENTDILHKLSELLLEKETVMGAELDDMISIMRPGIVLPSHPIDDGDAGDVRRLKPKRRRRPSRPSAKEETGAMSMDGGAEESPESGTDSSPDSPTDGAMSGRIHGNDDGSDDDDPPRDR